MRWPFLRGSGCIPCVSAQVHSTVSVYLVTCIIGADAWHRRWLTIHGIPLLRSRTRFQTPVSKLDHRSDATHRSIADIQICLRFRNSTMDSDGVVYPFVLSFGLCVVTNTARALTQRMHAKVTVFEEAKTSVRTSDFVMTNLVSGRARGRHPAPAGTLTIVQSCDGGDSEFKHWTRSGLPIVGSLCGRRFKLPLTEVTAAQLLP